MYDYEGKRDMDKLEAFALQDLWKEVEPKELPAEVAKLEEDDSAPTFTQSEKRSFFEVV